LLAKPGDRILTSDPDDITRIALAAANRAVIVASAATGNVCAV